MKNPVRPSSTLGTLTLTRTDVAFKRSYVSGTGVGDNSGNAGPRLYNDFKVILFTSNSANLDFK